MEQTPGEQPLQEEINPLCQHCHTNPILEGYPSPLCDSCRKKFIRFPIPAWVKGFGAGVIVLVLVGLISFPKQINIGIHVKRAEIALSSKKFLTAERELQKVLIAAPEMKTAKTDMLIASYYNMDMRSFVTTLNELKDVTFENSPGFKTAQDLVEDAKNFFPSDSLSDLLKQNPSPPDIQNQFRSYVLLHPEEPYAVSNYVNDYYKTESLDWCDSIVHSSLNRNPASMTAIMAAIFVARMQHRYDSATRYCNQLLAMNAECSYAIAAKARICMAKGDMEVGMRLARKACTMDSADGYCVATLALGYHLNHQPADRDRLIASKASDSSVSTYLDYVKQIMSGKEKFN